MGRTVRSSTVGFGLRRAGRAASGALAAAFLLCAEGAVGRAGDELPEETSGPVTHSGRAPRLPPGMTSISPWWASLFHEGHVFSFDVAAEHDDTDVWAEANGEQPKAAPAPRHEAQEDVIRCTVTRVSVEGRRLRSDLTCELGDWHLLEFMDINPSGYWETDGRALFRHFGSSTGPELLMTDPPRARRHALEEYGYWERAVDRYDPDQELTWCPGIESRETHHRVCFARGLGLVAVERYNPPHPCPGFKGRAVARLSRWSRARQTKPPKGFIEVARGTFPMGAPTSEAGWTEDQSLHQVTISRAFWLQATEVTQAQWRALMGENPAGFRTCGGGCPVERVSWEDAWRYLNRLSEKEGLPPCYEDGVFAGLACEGYRLPTEAEWEYAARAGTLGPRYGALDAVAWYAGQTGGGPQPGGRKRPNAWGFLDMLGNVQEWVQDCHGPTPAHSQEQAGSDTCDQRIARGGGWNSQGEAVRAAARVGRAPTGQSTDLGFRAARSKP
jgi:sulfatase modifying factor 1